MPPDAPPTTRCDLGDTTSAPSIVVAPNSGHDPCYSGDRGTAGQYAVLIGLVLALALIVALVVRQSRRARAWAQRSDGPD